MTSNISFKQDVYIMVDKKLTHLGNGIVPFNVPDWVNWIAQDESGLWWGYSVEPLRHDHGWYENEVGDYIRLGSTELGDWAESLYRTK